jgi:hypothetical protein
VIKHIENLRGCLCLGCIHARRSKRRTHALASPTQTPLHPGAYHKHAAGPNVPGSEVKRGRDESGRWYKVYICKCGCAFFFEPD